MLSPHSMTHQPPLDVFTFTSAAYVHLIILTMLIFYTRIKWIVQSRIVKNHQIYLIIYWLVVLTILKNMKVNGKDFPIYYGKQKNVPTHQQV
jgi:hypothetical protein